MDALPRVSASILLIAVLTAVAGCGNSGGATPEKKRIAATVVDVVEGNMMAAEAGDARAYCAVYTERYLHKRFHGGVDACIAKFKGAPDSLLHSGEVRYLGAVIEPDDNTLAAVHYQLGKTRGLDYIMKLTELPDGRKRWLIDDRLVPVE
ncbi:MAG: hypothetical protein QOG86_1595 [Thermoleophilaceae bacterium]|nr:hypothetical protein [Thermoleophilaceae bacterium]